MDIIGLLLGAFLAGTINGLLGFGTALVASAIWFQVLEAELVPPLLILTAFSAQLLGALRLHAQMDWRAARPMILWGLLGVPLGSLALLAISPEALKPFIGVLLIVYVASRAGGRALRASLWLSQRRGDALAGLGGGFLGGLAGLSGPLPLIWSQLQGRAARAQRSLYQPFNVTMLGLASLALVATGQISWDVLRAYGVALPAALLGAALGVRFYRVAPEALLARFVLICLGTSGCVLLLRAFAEGL